MIDEKIAKDVEAINKLLRNNLSKSRNTGEKQLIYFGAPGTGKSRTLNDLAKAIFEASDNLSIRNEDEVIKSAIQKAGKDLSLRLAIGVHFESKLKNMPQKDIENKYSCSGRTAYRICQGTKITEIANKLSDCTDEEIITDVVKKELSLLTKDKQASYAAIGYKYSQFFDEMTYGDIEKMLGLSDDTTSTVQWINAGAKIKEEQYDAECKKEIKHIERVTFHPNYTYAHFVGTYKPIQDGKEIAYKYVPGPFMRTYVRAKQAKSNEKFLLLIEEINRANVAAVFGDVFQLLDRNKDGVSEYPIAASEDVKKYLKDDCEIDDCEELKIPDNMYIWATMNSADQGVLPMDTAFKRRWEFEYIDINHNASEIDGFYFPTSVKKDGDENESYIFENWNSLRIKLNEKLQSIGVNEDKLLGPFFINKDSLEKISSLVESKIIPKKYDPIDFSITADDIGKQNQKDIVAFQKSFESKVLMYLYEDMRMHRDQIFQIKNIEKPRLSQIFDAFENDGVKIFNFSTNRS